MTNQWDNAIDFLHYFHQQQLNLRNFIHTNALLDDFPNLSHRFDRNNQQSLL
jgi:hypothetical protein